MPSKKSKKPPPGAGASDSEGEDDLQMDDVLALGGNEDDFNLVKSAAPGVLVVQQQTSLVEQLEVKKMLKELGLGGDGSSLVVIKDDEVEEEEEEAEEEVIESAPEPTPTPSPDVKARAVRSKENKPIPSPSPDVKTRAVSSNEKEPIPTPAPNVKTRAVSSNENASPQTAVTRHQPVALPVEIPQLSKLIPGKPLPGYIVKPTSSWMEIKGVDGVAASTKNDLRVVDVYRQAARKIHEMELEKYSKEKAADNSGDARWLKTVLQSGTMSDRVAALALLVQESPIHQMPTLSNLLMMANKKVKREALIAVDTVKELFLANLLPEDRKLRSFAERPFGQLKTSDGKQMYRQLLLWHAEDELKKGYASLITALESLLKDPQLEIRRKVLAIAYQLLAERPEQEQALLRMIANKLGDPERRLASTASHYLLLLVNKHPNMRLVIVTEVERFMYRPNLADRARYYAVCFLNQQILSRSDTKIANKLVTVYFSFYSKFSGKKLELDSRMLSALLVGVNRAFPFAELKDEELDTHINTLYATVHKSTFNASVQALMLLFQIMQSRQSVSDRFYCALYTKLLDHTLVASSKQTVFMNLLYKAMKADPCVARVKAFIKRLLQICNMMPPSFVCGALFIISELSFTTPAVRTIIDHPEDVDDEEHFKDVPDEDDDNKCSSGEDQESDAAASDDEKEADSAEGSGSEAVVETATREEKVDAPSARATAANRSTGRQQYNAFHRNPLYCGAENSCSWEIRQYAQHYHPSVRTFAEQIISATRITYKGDPLQDFTLVRFLDRFVFRNPKKKIRDHGGSAMQRKETSHLLTELPVNHTSFWSKREDKIRPDEIFYHRYFRQLHQLHPNKMKGKAEEDAEELAEAPLGDDDAMDFAGDISTVVKTNKKEQGKKAAGKRKRQAQDSDDDGGDDAAGDDNDVSDDEFEQMLLDGEDGAGSSGSEEEPEFDGDDDAGMLQGSDDGGDDNEDLGAEDFDQELGDEFNYSDLDEMSEDDDVGSGGEDGGEQATKAPPKEKGKKDKKKKKFTDAEYEKALFDNLSSDEDGSGGNASSAAGGADLSKMFMGADEFAAMLEKKKSSKHGSSSQLLATDGVSQKQLDWEEKRINAGRNFRQRKRQFKRK